MKHTKDVLEKALVNYKDVFSDICNVFFFDGKKVIKEEDLEDAQPTSYYVAEGEIKGQERDVCKYWRKGNLMINIAKIGIENQTSVDVYMPIRVMSYDSADYRLQFGHKLPLIPVVTIVLYFGIDKWPVNRNLYSLLDIPENLKKYVSDYQVNILELANITKSETENFTSDMKNMAEYLYCKQNDLPYKGSKVPLKHPDEFIALMEEVADDKRIGKVYNIEKKKKKEVSMCTLLDKMVNEGEARGEIRGEKRGSEKTAIATASRLIESGKLSLEEISEATELSLEKVEELAGKVSVSVCK